jgi:hypothetical protein
MTKQLLTIFTVFFLLSAQCKSQDIEKKTNSSEPFETAEVYLEQNATDGDAEVVFIAKAGDKGMTKFLVVAPDGRTVIDFEAPDPTTIGIRQFHLESPEPPNIEAVKKAYPPGVYKFYGTTTDSTEYFSESILNHTLPSAAVIHYPADMADDVSTNGLEITWSPVEGAKAYLIEVEQEDSDVKIEATLISSKTSFVVPDKFLLEDTEYKIVIGTMAENANLNFVEISFSTTKL